MSFSGEQRFRVYNRCKYDIGVTLLNGASLAIRAGSFQLITVNDILFIESICADRKFFSQRMLVPVNDAGEEVSLDELGIYVDENAPEHLTSDAIKAVLRQAPKKIEAWLESISDPAELDALK